MAYRERWSKTGVSVERINPEARSWAAGAVSETELAGYKWRGQGFDRTKWIEGGRSPAFPTTPELTEVPRCQGMTRRGYEQCSRSAIDHHTDHVLVARNNQPRCWQHGGELR